MFNAARINWLLVSVLNVLLANMAIMVMAVQILGLHYLFGLAAALIIVPAMVFLINKFWAFKHVRYQ